MAVLIRLLGPVEVAAAGRPVDLGPPQRRAVLAAVAVDAGRPVSAQVVVDRVWGEAPPAAVRSAVHVHVTRLRRALEQVPLEDATPPPALLHRSGGYVLAVDPDRVDLLRFRDLAARARRPGHPDADRVTILAEALALWTGPALTGVPGGWAAQSRETWARERLDAAVDWAQAMLRLGRHAEAVGSVRALLAEHPLSEPLVAVLMRALVAAGRPAEALDNYATVRTRLAEELGTDPGPELRALHAAVLRGEPLPAAPAPPSTGAGSPRTGRGAAAAAAETPAQLPADVAGFTGRLDELGRLTDLLDDADRSPTAVVITAIAGTAGVGKTALAVHWAHQVTDRFPDGQLYVNLRGFDPGGAAVSPGEALRGFLDALGVPPQRLPATLDAQAALYRSRLAGRRMLVLLDNARDADQVRPLLPGAPGCLAVVTSRQHLTGLVATDGAFPLALDLLCPEEARDLLTRRLGVERVKAEPEAVDEIITACARLPLALAVVAARAATHPALPLHALATELRDAHGALDPFAGDDPVTDVRAVFSWSERALSGPAARLFRLLGLHPGPDCSLAAAASLAGLPTAEVRPLLAELTRAHLLSEQVPGRYGFHDLLRAYAAELADSAETAADRHAAMHRMLDHYLHTAHPAAALIQPHRDPITVAPAQPGVVATSIADRGDAVSWFAVEHAGLLAAIAQAARTGFDTHTCQLTWTVAVFLDRRGLWQDKTVVQHASVAAARRLGDRAAQAYAHRDLGRAYTWLGRHDEAHEHYRSALDLYQQVGDHTGEAHTHLSLGWVLELQGRAADAIGHAQQALAAYRAAGHRHGQANALNNIGWLHAVLDQHQEALARSEEALALLQELGDREGQAAAWDSVGHARHRLGEYDEATACYSRALELYRDVGYRYNEADTLTHLAETHLAAGDPVAAQQTWHRALDILDELDHPDADKIRAKLS